MRTRNTIATVAPLLDEAEKLGLIGRWEEVMTHTGRLQYKIYHPFTNHEDDGLCDFHNKYGGVFDIYSFKEVVAYLRGAFNAWGSKEK